MQETYIEDLGKFIKNKKRLEKELEVEITNKGKLLFVKGDAENEYTTLQIIDALNLNFSIDSALLLKNEENLLQIVHIKDLTKRNDLERIRARIIGKDGRTLKTLHNLTDCEVSLKDNDVGIIGNAETIADAVQAVTSIIYGSKQGNVYARLEKQRKRKRIEGKLPIKNELK